MFHLRTGDVFKKIFFSEMKSYFFYLSTVRCKIVTIPRFGADLRYTKIRVDIDVGRGRTRVPMRVVSVFCGVEVRGRAGGSI